MSSTTLETLNSIDVWKPETWPLNKVIAQAYYDLTFDFPNHEKSDFWMSQYEYHWQLYLDGQDKYIPF